MTQPLTNEEVDARVKLTMQTQQTEMLKLAAENALKLVREEATKSASGLVEKIDKTIDKSKEHSDHVWSNAINKSNFNALREIKQMWERTERFVGACNVSPDDKELKDGAMKYITEGKKLTHERIKVLRYADRDGRMILPTTSRRPSE